MQQQGGAEPTFHVTVAQNIREVSVRCFVRRLGGRGELARLEYAEHYGCTAMLLGMAAFYAKFHV